MVEKVGQWRRPLSRGFRLSRTLIGADEHGKKVAALDNGIFCLS